MQTLNVNFLKCEDCYKCEEILPGFRTTYGGIQRADNSSADEKLRSKFLEVKVGCPAKAIILKRH